MHRRAICPPFLARYVWHYPYPLEEAAMVAAAGVVVGEHDFTSFAAVDPERAEGRAAGENVHTTKVRPTNVPTVFSSSLTRECEELISTVRGTGFFHHLVRKLGRP